MEWVNFLRENKPEFTHNKSHTASTLGIMKMGVPGYSFKKADIKKTIYNILMTLLAREKKIVMPTNQGMEAKAIHI